MLLYDHTGTAVNMSDNTELTNIDGNGEGLECVGHDYAAEVYVKVSSLCSLDFKFHVKKLWITVVHWKINNVTFSTPVTRCSNKEVTQMSDAPVWSTLVTLAAFSCLRHTVAIVYNNIS